MKQCGSLIRKIITGVLTVVIRFVLAVFLIAYRVVSKFCLCLIAVPVIFYIVVCMPFLHRIPILRKTVAVPLEFVFWTISGFMCMPISFSFRRRKPCFALTPIPVFGHIDFNPGASETCGILAAWADRNGFRKHFCFQVKKICPQGQFDCWCNMLHDSFCSGKTAHKDERVLAVWYEEEGNALLLLDVTRQKGPACIDTETVFYTVCNGENRLTTSDNGKLLFGPLNPRCFH